MLFSKIKKNKKKDNHQEWLDTLDQELPTLDSKKAKTLEREELLSALEKQESQRNALIKKIKTFVSDQEEHGKKAADLNRKLEQEREEKEQFKMMYFQTVDLAEQLSKNTLQLDKMRSQVNNFVQDLLMTFTEQNLLLEQQATQLPSFADIQSYGNEIKFIIQSFQDNFGGTPKEEGPSNPKLLQTIAEHEKRIGEQNAQIEEQVQNIKTLQEQIDTCMNNNNILQTQCNKQTDDISLYSEQLKSYYSTIQNQKVQHQLKIDEMGSELGQLQEAHDLQQNKLEDYFREKNALKTNNIALKDSLTAAQHQQSRLQELLLKKQAKIDQLIAEQEKPQEQSIEVKKVEVQVQPDREEESERVDHLERQVDQQNTQLRELYLDLETAQDKAIRADTLQAQVLVLLEEKNKLDTLLLEQKETIGLKEQKIESQDQVILCLTAKRELALKQLGDLRLEVDMQREARQGQSLPRVVVEEVEGRMEVNVGELLAVFSQLKRLLNNAYKHFVLAVFDLSDQEARETLLPVEKQLNEVIRRFQELLDRLEMESGR